jgi:hypothetical protein
VPVLGIYTLGIYTCKSASTQMRKRTKDWPGSEAGIHLL